MFVSNKENCLKSCTVTLNGGKKGRSCREFWGSVPGLKSRWQICTSVLWLASFHMWTMDEGGLVFIVIMDLWELLHLDEKSFFNKRMMSSGPHFILSAASSESPPLISAHSTKVRQGQEDSDWTNSPTEGCTSTCLPVCVSVCVGGTGSSS